MSTDTIHVTHGTEGVAWRLLCPSSSGGKVYTIAVIGKAVVTAWGKASAAGAYGGGSQAQVRYFPSNDHALGVAMEVTRTKEGRGYHLDIQPKRFTLQLPLPTDLDLTALDAAQHILKHGSQV